MLIERSKISVGWRWRIIDTALEPSYQRLLTGDWQLLIIGSYLPAMLAWLEDGIRDGKTPSDLLRTVWERFDGHCAIIFVHQSEDLLIIGVDPYAIAKVYIYSDSSRWLIGTRLVDLLRRASENRLDVHQQACAYFLLKGYTPALHTFYDEVSKVPPGTILTVQSGIACQSCYLDICGAATVPGYAYLEEVHKTWKKSLSDCLNGFELHQVALSGGIDSTTLLASLVRLGIERERCVAKTIVVRGGPGNVVLNPFDRDFARRISKHYQIRHDEVSYSLSAPGVVFDFLRTVPTQGTEDAIGSLLFQTLGASRYTSTVGSYVAQNADSILSFAIIGSPMLVSHPPFFIGLGGWCNRYNLFGGLDRRFGIEDGLIRILLDRYLKRQYGVSLSSRNPKDRLFGMAFNLHKWPVHLTDEDWPYLTDVEGLADWFDREYIIRTDLLSLFEENPHAAFIWLFLHGYMQGTANRGSAWSTGAYQNPTFLPWASLGILRLTAKLIPDRRFCWYGKYLMRWMARSCYQVPGYVVKRSDPPTPELDRQLLATFFANDGVYEYLRSFFPQRAQERFYGIMDESHLVTLITQFENRQFDRANLHLLLRLAWFLTQEQLVWR
ncbi:MAG: hypothetical protein WCC06_03930 [Candidatus Aminicenantales bacterium]